jgi:uncharacterized protein YmfQ (DUF2313 family)
VGSHIVAGSPGGTSNLCGGTGGGGGGGAPGLSTPGGIGGPGQNICSVLVGGAPGTAGTPSYTLTAGGNAGPGAGGGGGTNGNGSAAANYGAGGGGGGPPSSCVNSAGGAGAPGCIIVIYTTAEPFVVPQWVSLDEAAVPDPIWRPKPHGAAALALLYFAKFFGAGGQAPTKFWRYDFDDQLPKWQGAPKIAAAMLQPAAATFFDQSGQAPAKFWRYDYLIEFPQWQGAPLRAATAGFPEPGKFFGVSGQAPTKFWRYDFDDQLPKWQGDPLLAASLRMPATTEFFGARGQAPIKFWRYDFDDQLPKWQGAPIVLATLPMATEEPAGSNTPTPAPPPVSPLEARGDQWVQRTGAEYALAWSGLLPTGPAWPREPDHVLQIVLAGLAQIWGDEVEVLAARLLVNESDPRQTVILLPDWEKAWGLPDECLAEPLTVADRQKALVAKMTMLGAQSRAFMTAQAAREGYAITIKEYAPFMCGVSRCGDTTAQNPDNDGSPRWQIGPPEMRFYWTTSIAQARLSWFRASSGQAGVDPMLRIGIATDLDCLLTRIKPAHTEIVFDYSGLAAGGPFAGTP